MTIKLQMEPWLEKFVRTTFCNGDKRVKVNLNTPLGRVFKNSIREQDKVIFCPYFGPEAPCIEFELSERIPDPDPQLLLQYFEDIYWLVNEGHHKLLIERGVEDFARQYGIFVSRQGQKIGLVGLEKVVRHFNSYYGISPSEFPWGKIRGRYKIQSRKRAK